MCSIRLEKPTLPWADAIEDYIREFPVGHMQATPDACAIPGLFRLADFPTLQDWLAYTTTMQGKITWFMAIREEDEKLLGFLCLRHDLMYDDDDPDFCSHIGYSIRPSEQGKGYAKAQLRLGLQEARHAGLTTVRLICRDVNIASSKVILACGGVLVDTLHGEESCMTVNRYDIHLA